MKLRLLITIDYEADPKFYGTDDPEEMAQIDYRNLHENPVAILDWVSQVWEEDIQTMRMSYAISPIRPT